MRLFPPRLLLAGIPVLLLLFPSCVSKKKYLEEVRSLNLAHDQELSQLRNQLDEATVIISDYELQLAERKGENNALVAMQDKLQGRIDALEAEIERLTNSAVNQQQSMDELLMQKEMEIEEKKQLIREIGKVLDEHSRTMDWLVSELRDSLMEEAKAGVLVDGANGQAWILLPEGLLFRPGSTSHLQTGGIRTLQKISEILVKYPTITVDIVGHTDNKPVPRKSLDNWDYGVLRATTIARLLTEELDLNPSQVTASGKAGFAPRASNETSEGRALNRRVELVIGIREADLARNIRKKIGATPLSTKKK